MAYDPRCSIPGEWDRVRGYRGINEYVVNFLMLERRSDVDRFSVRDRDTTGGGLERRADSSGTPMGQVGKIASIGSMILDVL